MKWFNVEISSLHAPEYIGSDPVHRATWLNLSAYCCEQENGGRIADCRDWKSRMWEQLCGVTVDEVLSDSTLWSWDGQDLVVWRYPAEREIEIRAKREGAKAGGLAKSAKYGRKGNRNSNRKGREGDGTPDGTATGDGTGNAIGRHAITSQHQAFIQGWCDNYRAFHGIDYQFDSRRDGKSVKEILATHILVPDLLEIAKMAWAKFKADSRAWNCRQAATIHGFRDRLNDIRLEVKYAGTNNQRVNPRTENTCRPTHSPEEMWAIKQRQQEAARLAREGAGTDTHPPEAGGNGSGTNAVVQGNLGSS